LKKIAKLRLLKKRLTVKTLSFIMAAGLLLLVVPFMAIAAGKEEPEPGKRGDFRLLKDYFAVTQVTLEKDMQPVPVVVPEDIDDADELTYQWQAYSVESEKYVNVSKNKKITLSENLAAKYDYGDGKSYFRCLATTEDERLLISDVLTVVLPAEESDPSQAEGETIATIDLLDSTQPEETEPTDSGEATTEPAQETTEPAQETTEPTTAPTQPAVDNGEKAAPAEDDDPIEGQFLKPMEDDTDDEDDLPPIRGMLLMPLGDAQTTYTVVYYVQKPIYTGNDNDTSNYEIFDYKTIDANQGDTVDLSGEMPGTTFDTFLTLNTNVSTTTGTVAADGSSVFHLYYTRQDFTFTIARGSGNSNIVLSTRRGRVTVNRANPYVFTVKYGESLVGLWPTDDMLTTRPSGYSRYLDYIRKDTSSYYYNSDDYFYSAPTVLDTSLVTKLRKRLASDQTNFPMHFVFTYDSKYRYAQYFFQKADGSWGTYPDFTIKGKNNSVFENCPTYEGFYPPYVPSSGTTREIRYTRRQFTLSFVSNDDETTVRSATYYFEQPLVDPGEPDDADFLGWYYDSGLTQSVNWGADTMPARSITVYGKWQTTVSTHTLTVKYLDDQGTEQNQSPITYNHNDSVPEPAKSWTGHTFDNWTYEDGTAVTWPVTMDGDKTVVAHWTLDTHTLTVKYVDDRGTEEIKSTTTYDYGASVREPATSWTGHTFVEWKYEDDSAVTWPVTMNADKTVVAHWTLNEYKLTVIVLDQNYNSFVWNEYDIPYSHLIFNTVPSEPVVEGYVFVRWLDRYGEPDSSLTNGTKTMPDSDLTIQAYMTRNYYTVTIKQYEDDSSDLGTVVVPHGDTVINNYSTYETRTGFCFDGWHYKDSSDAEQTFEFGVTEVKGAWTVYAKWKEITLTIINDGKDNVFSVSKTNFNLRVFVPEGGSVTIRQIPYGTYTINGESWDFENTYTAVTTTLNETTVTPVVYEFTAEPAVTAKAPFYWLRGAARG